MKKVQIPLPHNFEPRPYQLPFFKAMAQGKKRAVLVHHRRAGKDLACFNFLIQQAYMTRGNYWYMFPQYNQGRKAIWEGITANGVRYLECIPKSIIKRINRQEMYIELNNAPKGDEGSIIRIVGSDTEGLVGAGLKGIVLSEYSLTSPSVWPYIEPMIIEQGGWAVFNGTPRGENHFYDLYMMAKDNPDWYASKLGVDKTKAVSEEEIERLRKEGTYTEEQIQQEYYCSFKGSMVGAYYSDQIEKAEQEGRLTELEYDESKPVHTVWDIGVRDSTAIWFYQLSNNQIRVIDYYEAKGHGLPHYIKVLNSKPYLYGDHYAPHDIGAREFGTGKTRLEQAHSLGVYFREVKKIPVADGINCVRTTLNRCIFDRKKCYNGIQALKSYRKVWDEVKACFSDKPLHDWSSHAADAFRYLAVSLDEKYLNGLSRPRQFRAIGDYITPEYQRYSPQFRQQNYLNDEMRICF